MKIVLLSGWQVSWVAARASQISTTFTHTHAQTLLSTEVLISHCFLFIKTPQTKLVTLSTFALVRNFWLSSPFWYLVLVHMTNRPPEQDFAIQIPLWARTKWCVLSRCHIKCSNLSNEIACDFCAFSAAFWMKCVSGAFPKKTSAVSDGGGVKCRSGVSKLETMWGSCPGNVQLGRLRAWTVVRREEIHYLISFLHGRGRIFYSASSCCCLRCEETRSLGVKIQRTRTSLWRPRQKSVFISL